MGTLENVIAKFAVQTVVYWANPVNDGRGNTTFDSPVEILVRWDDKTQVVTDSQGKERTSSAEVLTNEEMIELEFLYLGSLSDFSSGADLSDPKAIAGAYEIITKTKVPAVRSTDDFVRTYFLGRRVNR